MIQPLNIFFGVTPIDAILFPIVLAVLIFGVLGTKYVRDGRMLGKLNGMASQRDAHLKRNIERRKELEQKISDVQNLFNETPHNGVDGKVAMESQKKPSTKK